MTTKRIAVLTGDLVHSTDLGPEKIERAFEALGVARMVLEDWHGTSTHMSRHRGDGWQAVLARPEMALRSALAIRAALRKIGAEFDTYVGIAVGEVEKEVGPDLNAETSFVFKSSGDALEAAKSMDDIRFLHSEDGAMAAATILADYVSQGWTPAQANAILPFLTPKNTPSYTDVAKMLGKTRQAVTKAAEAAALLPLDLALASIERPLNA